ncbi:chorismate-binding protein [Christiangramia aquimixticola]|uniref:chorismate-binding protein n=1 Tax=Christiangramia aquimixticola TaxID=1697558 RepID=UPI003AA7C1E3
MKSSVEIFEELKTQLNNKLPFVVYKKPGESFSKAIVQNDSQNFEANLTEAEGFIFAPFDSKDTAYLIPAAHSDVKEFRTEVREEDNKEANIPDEFLDFEFRETDQKEHEILVQKGIDAIKTGDLKKVVLARSEEVSVHDPDPFRIYKNLIQKYPQAFVYLWFHPETGIWMGATPERLIRTERTKFKTMALAGTQVDKGSAEVEWRQKEIEEQLFVTDYILESLEKKEEVKTITAGKPFTSKAGKLLHICTEITGSMNTPGDLKGIIEALHPTPAVCGLPREQAFNFIKSHEKFQREYYTGYLGEINYKTEVKRNSNRRNQENQQFGAISKRSDLFVNLRCMKLVNGKARIFVGGGITKDSNAAEEWMETVNKSQIMKSVLVK